MPRCRGMRALLLTLLLAACGDNIHPAPPAPPDKPGPGDWNAPEPDGINPGDDELAPDAAVAPAPDAATPCDDDDDDRHVDEHGRD